MSENLGITWQELKDLKSIPSAPNQNERPDYKLPDSLYSCAADTLDKDPESNAWFTAQLAKQVAKQRVTESGAGFDGHNIESKGSRMGYRSTMGATGAANAFTYGAPMIADSVYADPLEIEAALYSLGIVSGTRYRYGYTIGTSGGPWYITMKPLGKMCVGAAAGAAEEFVTVPDPFVAEQLRGTVYEENYLKPLPIVDIYPNARRLPLLPGKTATAGQGHPYSWPVGGSVSLLNNRINYGVYAPARSVEIKMVKGTSGKLDLFGGLSYNFPLGMKYNMTMRISFIDDMYRSLQTYLIDYLRRTVSPNNLGVVPWQNLLWEIDLVMLRPGPAVDKCFRFIALIDSNDLNYSISPTFHGETAMIDVNFSIVGTLDTLWDKMAAYGDNPSLLISSSDTQRAKPITLGDFRLGDPSADINPITS